MLWSGGEKSSMKGYSRVAAGDTERKFEWTIFENSWCKSWSFQLGEAKLESISEEGTEETSKISKRKSRWRRRTTKGYCKFSSRSVHTKMSLLTCNTSLYVLCSFDIIPIGSMLNSLLLISLSGDQYFKNYPWPLHRFHFRLCISFNPSVAFTKI